MKNLKILFLISTVIFSINLFAYTPDNEIFVVSAENPAVFLAAEQAERVVRSKIWKKAHEVCKDSALPILNGEMSFETLPQTVKGSAHFTCGL